MRCYDPFKKEVKEQKNDTELAGGGVTGGGGDDLMEQSFLSGVMKMS